MFPDVWEMFADIYIFNRCAAAAKHAEFLRARGRHYSNEAEAMKVRQSCIHIGVQHELT